MIRVIETAQTVLAAILLAFVFRSFLIEPFIIPTGSMAESLLGEHESHTCTRCGWEFAVGVVEAGVQRETLWCPNCQNSFSPPQSGAVRKAGDRILVHKWPYQLFSPRAWDVIVFRDPVNPVQTYIKRLVALPGQTVEIIQGDVFIDGRILRKTAAAQQALWFIVHDQTHLPRSGSDPISRWRAPGSSDEGGWRGMETRVIEHLGEGDEERALVFEPDLGEYFYDLYGYNRGSSGVRVFDVRVLADVQWRGGDGTCTFEIEHDEECFKLRLGGDGTIRLWREGFAHGADRTEFGERPWTKGGANRLVRIEFGFVDHRVYAKIDGADVLASDDENYPLDIEQLRLRGGMRTCRLSVAARRVELSLSRLRIERDVYYSVTSRTRRATAGNGFRLGPEEYFVLGDNSPDSHDSREWREIGPHMPTSYRPGTVRADQIVGQAGFVYLPGLVPIGSSARFKFPDLGRMRFVR